MMGKITIKKTWRVLLTFLGQGVSAIVWMSTFVYILYVIIIEPLSVSNASSPVMYYSIMIVLSCVCLLQAIEQSITPFLYYRHDKEITISVEESSGECVYHKKGEPPIVFNVKDIKKRICYNATNIYVLFYEIIVLENGTKILLSNFIPFWRYLDTQDIKRVNHIIISYCWSWRLFCNNRKV